MVVENMLLKQVNNTFLSRTMDGVVPDHWNWVKLEDICDISMGQSPSSETYNTHGSGLPFLQGKAEFTSLYPLPTIYCTHPIKVAKKGNILFSVRAPVGDVNIADQDYIIGRGLAAISLREGYNDFLFYCLLYNKEKIKTLGSGTTFISINRAVLEKFPILLPPLLVQQAIARVLQSAQNATQTRRKELELEHERKAALMRQLFKYGISGNGSLTKETPYGDVPDRWCIQTLDQCSFVQTGVTKGRKFKDQDIVTLPYLRVANVQDGYLDLTEMKEIELHSSEVERYKLHPGDVVVTEGGDFDKLGRGFIWHGEVANCVHQNHVFAIRANQEVLLPEYLAYLIQSEYGKSYFLSVAHRTTNLACINSTKLKAFPALLPSLDEQQEIARVLQSCDSKIAALEKEITLHEELFRTLLDELMTGRLSALLLVE